ncbi:GDP-L-fucose synthase [Pontimonas sp.]|nr:GDP-L-fucose synthase [Pontimonas sp.]MDB4607098.1 GDP-L-fucose synthase [Pontimonas sp.]MDC0991610.1 GDP-L-fucose synthase [Pontimonas sp.]
MKLTDTIYIAGHRGLAGSAIWRHFEKAGYENLVGLRSDELDLTNRDATLSAMREISPSVVIDAAAKVGGIHANDTYPADFLSQNLQMQVNLMDAAHAAGVDRLLFLGSSCIYPKFAPQPIPESAILTGALEETNDAYGIAKIAGILQVQAMRRQHGYRWISAMPTNLYGPNDNYHPENSHVLAALIRKFHDAKKAKEETVTIWGSGTPLREFLHVDDLASAIEFLLLNYDEAQTINIGSGHEVSIQDLAQLIADVVGFSGTLVNDSSKPDGTPRKMLDSSRLNKLGWSPVWDLRAGIVDAYRWFVDNESSLRAV